MVTPRPDGARSGARYVTAEKAKVRPGRRSPTDSLNREQAVYEANLSHWLPDHEGEHVLIRGDEVVGYNNTCDEALAAGYMRFGVVPLVVKLVASTEPVHHLPNGLL